MQLTAELILAIIGCATGTTALIIHLIRFWREKPHLRIELADCYHSFLERTPLTPSGTKLIVKFDVDNIGDRGTRFNRIQVFFRAGGKNYQSGLVELYETGFHEILGTPAEREGEGVRIDAHDSGSIDHYFFFEGESITKKSIKCVFTLYHTHGKKSIQATSILEPK